MLNIRFVNRFGTLQLCGGEHPLLELESVSGLSLPEQEVKVAVFSGLAGQRVIAKRDLPRKITIAGDAFQSDARLAEAAAMLYAEGTLHIQNSRMHRSIGARCISFSDRRTDQGITLAFLCDNPYFHDAKERTVPVYSRLKLVSSPFTLPCVFSERVWQGNCENPGSVNCEPVVRITNHGAAQSGFSVRNTTTGAALAFDLEIGEGEEITVSVPDRTVVNQNGENLLHTLSEGSYLSEFYLAPGENQIRFNGQGDLRCSFIYNVNYTEAAI